MKTQIILAVLLLSTCARCDDEAFPLLDSGRQAIIIGQSLYLADAARKCSGITLRQIPEDRHAPQPGDFPLYLGDTKMGREVLAEDIKTLDEEGYIILITPDAAFVYCGGQTTDTGNKQVYAEADFCRKFLGVEQYFPGELGSEYPPHDKVLIPCGKYIENPAFKHRQMSGLGFAGLGSWRLRGSGGGGRYQFHHNLFRIIDPSKFKDRPDFFPVIPERLKDLPVYAGVGKGERFVPQPGRIDCWQPCVTNPELRQAASEHVIKYFDAHPERRSYSLGANDSKGYCCCSRCLASTPPGIDPDSEDAVPRRFFDFYNQVAATVAVKHPDTRLGFLFYEALNNRMPDSLHPSLMPYVTQNLADGFDKTYLERNYRQIKELCKTARHVGLYEYLYGRGFMIPRIYSATLAKGLRFAWSAGVDGFYAEAYPNWGLDGPKLWIAERLLWNPDQDERKLLDLWCVGLFKEAAPRMKAYFEFLEETWMSQPPPTNGQLGMYRMLGAKHEQFTAVFPPKTCERAWRLLETAEKAASQEIVKKRVAYFKDSFAAVKLASSRHHAALKVDELGKHGDVPLCEWLAALDSWAALPTLQERMLALRTEAPLAFNEFWDANPESFKKWDTSPATLIRIDGLVVGETLKSAPRNLDEWRKSLSSVLDGCAAQSTCAIAATLIRERLWDVAVNAQALGGKPLLDGRIEEVWGKPSFDGNFFVGAESRSPLRTQFWLGKFKGKLYAAFKCHTTARLPLDKGPCGRDQVELRPGTSFVSTRSMPYMNHAAAGICLASGRFIAVATATGGLLDAEQTRNGLDVAWNGATAKSAIDADGWTAEMEITAPDEVFAAVAEGTVSGFNFFRYDEDGRKSSWAPAPLETWFDRPRSSGVVFWQ